MLFFRPNFSKVFVICGVLLFCSAQLSTAVQALEIKVKEHAELKGEKIYLGDIASFFPETDARISELMKLEIAAAPAPGNTFRLNKRFLNYKIGSETDSQDDILLTVPSSLEVKRAAQLISSLQLEKIFKDYIKENAPWPENAIFFEKISVPGTLALPRGKLSWDVSGRHNQHYTGNVALTVNFQVDNNPIRKVSLTGRISITHKVLKAARRIKKGQMISEKDLALVTEKTIQMKKGILSDLDEAVGKRSVRSIRSGQILTPQMIEDPPLVKKGNRVLIKAENKLIKITTFGRVLEDGRAGDQVRVVNISSGKEIFATVWGRGVVQVDF
ncbi:flagellar basal body P-ring formation chaperone FlgA [Thermodesulfobacteriota bacterium]